MNFPEENYPNGTFPRVIFLGEGRNFLGRNFLRGEILREENSRGESSLEGNFPRGIFFWGRGGIFHRTLGSTNFLKFVILNRLRGSSALSLTSLSSVLLKYIRFSSLEIPRKTLNAKFSK